LLFGLKFYTKDGTVVLQAGFGWVDFESSKTHTMHLKDGERVLGYKSRSDPDYPNHASHFDFQLIIGRLSRDK
jgi:hypothetical protein